MEKIFRQLRLSTDYSEVKKKELLKQILEKSPLALVTTSLDNLLQLANEWLLVSIRTLSIHSASELLLE
jgi:hypothetical protein